MFKEALFYERVKGPGSRVRCLLCSHFCLMRENESGKCRVRKNEGGMLISSNYGRLAAEQADPVEKKPFFHFLPGSSTYSVASPGCNFKCGFCQNWNISQYDERDGIHTVHVAAEEVVAGALDRQCKSVSYTYTEPTVYFEFAYECAVLAREKGLYNTFVTNGFMSRPALDYVTPYINAVNVDLKSYRDSFYRKVCGGRLKPVLDNIIAMKKNGLWVEITTLLIPSYNDSSRELRDIAEFICSVDRSIPWHVSGFYPAYKFRGYSPAEGKSLEKAYRTGKDAGLDYVYLGNVHSEEGENTYCPVCGKLLLRRRGFSVYDKFLSNGRCAYCGKRIAGVWE